MLLTHSWLCLRHWHGQRASPWRLLRLGDQDLQESDNVTIAIGFANTNRRCLPPGLTQQLRDYILRLAPLVTWNVADVGWRHGRNRRRSQVGGHRSGLHSRPGSSITSRRSSTTLFWPSSVAPIETEGHPSSEVCIAITKEASSSIRSF